MASVPWIYLWPKASKSRPPCYGVGRIISLCIILYYILYHKYFVRIILQALIRVQT